MSSFYLTLRTVSEREVMCVPYSSVKQRNNCKGSKVRNGHGRTERLTNRPLLSESCELLLIVVDRSKDCALVSASVKCASRIGDNF